ncbi:hypothetical protein Hypma_014354 [Hypsizygus marmoreus]|uniref:Uncharacterized protein n=1 Tax=Hypsizygus marmoreus TaxID=39966 RepID=A0A369JD06_HYPMA|nr:hypothetical protein Hypma_014354 [Hypsizygus marmoreus]
MAEEGAKTAGGAAMQSIGGARGAGEVIGGGDSSLKDEEEGTVDPAEGQPSMPAGPSGAQRTRRRPAAARTVPKSTPATASTSTPTQVPPVTRRGPGNPTSTGVKK